MKDQEIIIDIKPNVVLSDETIRLKCIGIAASISEKSINCSMHNERFNRLCDSIYNWVKSKQADNNGK